MGWRSTLQSHGWSCSFSQQLSLLWVWWLMTVFVFYSSNTVVVTSTMIPSALTTPGITSEYNSTTYFASVGQVYINKTEHNRTNACASRNMVHSHKSKTVTGIHLGAVLESSIQCKLQNATSTSSHPFSVNASTKWICVIYQETVSGSYAQCLTLMHSVQIGVSVISQSIIPTLQWQTCHIHRLWLKQQHQWIWNRMDNTMTHTNQHCQFQYYQLHVVWLQHSISPSLPSNFTSPSTFRKKVHAWMLSDDEEEPGAEYEYVHVTHMKERYFPFDDSTRLVQVSEWVRRKKIPLTSSIPSTSLATPSLTSLSSSAPVTSSTTSLAAPSLTSLSSTSSSPSLLTTSSIPSTSLITPSLTTSSSASVTPGKRTIFRLWKDDYDPGYEVLIKQKKLLSEINKVLEQDLRKSITSKLKEFVESDGSKPPQGLNYHNNYAAIGLSRTNPDTKKVEYKWDAAASDPDEKKKRGRSEESFAHSEPIALVKVLNQALYDGWFDGWKKPAGFKKFILDDVYDYENGVIKEALSSLNKPVKMYIFTERGLCIQHTGKSCTIIFSPTGVLQDVPTDVYEKVQYSLEDRGAKVRKQMAADRTTRVKYLRDHDMTDELQTLVGAYEELAGVDNDPNFHHWFFHWYEKEKEEKSKQGKKFDPDIIHFLKSSFTKWDKGYRGLSPKVNYDAYNKFMKTPSLTISQNDNNDPHLATSTSTSTAWSIDPDAQHDLDMERARRQSRADQDNHRDPLLSSSSDTPLSSSSSSSFSVHTSASITSTSTSTRASTTPTSARPYRVFNLWATPTSSTQDNHRDPLLSSSSDTPLSSSSSSTFSVHTSASITSTSTSTRASTTPTAARPSTTPTRRARPPKRDRGRSSSPTKATDVNHNRSRSPPRNRK